MVNGISSSRGAHVPSVACCATLPSVSLKCNKHTHASLLQSFIPHHKHTINPQCLPLKTVSTLAFYRSENLEIASKLASKISLNLSTLWETESLNCSKNCRHYRGSIKKRKHGNIKGKSQRKSEPGLASVPADPHVMGI